MLSWRELFGTVPRLVMGENDTFIGGEDWLANKGIEVVNLSASTMSSEKPLLC